MYEGLTCPQRLARELDEALEGLARFLHIHQRGGGSIVYTLTLAPNGELDNPLERLEERVDECQANYDRQFNRRLNAGLI